ncbi:MAG: hypothetical protein LBJ11_06410 [Oscillospiraceae bacterium]|nr:hypothetical protein [Oscillospiraceae bacterium]
MARTKLRQHEPYYAIPALLQLNRISRSEAAALLGVTQRTFDDRIAGYGDFSIQDAAKLGQKLNEDWSQIFLE